MSTGIATLTAFLLSATPLVDVAGHIRAALLREEVKRSTVLLVTYDRCDGVCMDQHIVGRASGVMITARGQIITNRHAVESPDGRIWEQILVVPTAESEGLGLACAYRAHVSGMSSRSDLAFLEPLDPLPCSTTSFILPQNSIPATGTDIQIVGYPSIGPGSPTLTVTNGQISGRSFGAGESVEFLKTDAKVISGVSGGAVIDEHGQLIGIATARTFVTNAQGSIDQSEEQLGLVIPSAVIWQAVAELTGDDMHAAGPAGPLALYSAYSARTLMLIEIIPLLLAGLILAGMMLRRKSAGRSDAQR